MSLPQVFNFDNKTVRTIEKDGEQWFVAADICSILGYKNAPDAVGRHCKGPVAGIVIHDGSQNREMVIIPERDIYRLVMKSKLPAAEKFENWVVSDVLPTIRKTGSYSQVPQSFASALKLAYEQQLVIDQQVKQLVEAQPKIEFFDAVTDSKDAIEIGTAAQVLNLGIGRNKLFAFLRDNKILKETNQPYQDQVDAGHFRIIEQKYNKPDGSTHINIKTVVYQKGLAFIRKRYYASKEAA